MAGEQARCWDPRYEFNAPRYYDFEAPNEDSEDDVWFDTAETAGLMSPETGGGDARVRTAQASSNPTTATAPTPLQKENAPAGTGKRAGNIVTSWNRRPRPAVSAKKAPLGSSSVDNTPASHRAATGHVGDIARPGQLAASGVAPKSSACGPGSAKRKRSSSAAQKSEPFVNPARGRENPQHTGAESKQGKQDGGVHKPKRSGTVTAEKGSEGGWKPLALQVAEFQSTLACHSHVNTRQPAPFVPRLTEPRDISFATDTRLRGSKFKPTEEAEAAEVALRSPFRARPVRRAVLLGTGSRGLPAVEAKPPTVPEPPHLATEERAALHPAGPCMSDSIATPFHALSLRRAILEGPTFVPHPSGQAPTAAQSPYLCTRSRAQAAKAADSADSGACFTMGAPDTGKARPVTRSHKKAGRSRFGVTEAHPFNLATDARGAAKQSVLERALAEKEAAAREVKPFKAKPAPHARTNATKAPPKASAKPTVPVPFDLESIARHEKAAAELEARRQRECELARREAEFKAQSIHLPKKPFVPAPSGKPPTKAQGIKLAVVTRSEARVKFDEEVSAKQAQLMAEKVAEEAARREKEAQDILEYRKTLQFKARPVPRHAR